MSDKKDSSLYESPDGSEEVTPEKPVANGKSAPAVNIYVERGGNGGYSVNIYLANGESAANINDEKAPMKAPANPVVVKKKNPNESDDSSEKVEAPKKTAAATKPTQPKDSDKSEDQKPAAKKAKRATLAGDLSWDSSKYGTGSDGTPGKPNGGRKGAWNCKGCGSSNFNFKKECQCCQAPK